MNAFGQLKPTGEYVRFKGLFAIDEDENMKTIEDKNLEECKEICTEGVLISIFPMSMCCCMTRVLLCDSCAVA